MDQQKQYAWNAADYAQHSSAQLIWAEELIAKCSLSGNERILDIGCGDGKITALLAEKVPDGSALGIDSSGEMIGLAESRFPQDQYPHLAFRQMDARKLDLPHKFDFIFSNAALHWVADHSMLLKKIAACMNPSGRVLFQMGGKGNAHGILSVIDTMSRHEPWRSCFQNFPFPYGFYGPEEYEGWLQAAGFDPLRLQLIPKTMKQKGEEGLAGWVRTTWLPYIERVPEESRETFIREVVARYAKDHPPDSEGNLCVEMVRLEVEAQKL